MPTKTTPSPSTKSATKLRQICAIKKIVIRYDRSRKNRIIVFYKNQRIGEARLLDLIANGKLKRRSRKQEGGAP